MTSNSKEQSKRSVRKHKDIRHPAIYLTLLILISIAVRTYLSYFPKLLFTYRDEFIYYDIAAELAHGIGSLFHPTYFRGPIGTYANRVLYSILIAPALLATDAARRQLLVSLLNAAYMTLGVIPAYLLSRDLTKNNKNALTAAFLYLLSSDLCYSMTFMSEVVFLPLAMTLIYLVYKTLATNFKEHAVAGTLYLLGTLLAGILLYLTKSTSMTLLAAAAFILVWKLLDDSTRKLKRRWIYFLALVAAGLIFYIVSVNGTVNIPIVSHLAQVLHRVIKSYTANGLNHAMGKTFAILRGILIASGFIPFLIVLACRRRYSKEEKYFAGFLFLTALLSLAYITKMSLTYSQNRDHLRYIAYLFPAFFILAQKGLVKTEPRIRLGKLPKLTATAGIALSVASVLTFQGSYWLQNASIVDQTMLAYVTDERGVLWKYYSILWLALIILTAIAIWSETCLTTTYMLFTWAFLAITLVNNFYTVQMYRYAYSIGAEEGFQTDLEAFVKKYPDNTFLVIDNIHDLTSTWDVNETSSRWADMHLVYPNVARISYERLLYSQNDEGYNLANGSLSILNASFFRSPDSVVEMNHFDYILVANSLQCELYDVNGDLAEPIGGVRTLGIESKYYKVYDNIAIRKNVNMIPRIELLENDPADEINDTDGFTYEFRPLKNLADHPISLALTLYKGDNTPKGSLQDTLSTATEAGTYTGTFQAEEGGNYLLRFCVKVWDGREEDEKKWDEYSLEWHDANWEGIHLKAGTDYTYSYDLVELENGSLTVENFRVSKAE